MFGYHGHYLRVDLSRRTQEWVPIDEAVFRRFLGGVGLGCYLLHQENSTGIDPLAPEACLLFVLSPLVGTPLTTSAKFAVVAKSPLTNRFNDALSSSSFALAAKRCGFDALAVVAACAEPTVLIIDDGQVRFEPAGDLWGMACSQATSALQDRLGRRFEIAVIGPAGENRVRYATLRHGRRYAGRGGLGAILGAKKVKAVAVAGSKTVAVADPKGVVAAARDLSRRSFGPATAKYRELGTLANLLVFNRLATLPSRNFQDSTFAEARALSQEALAATRHVARDSCAACTIGCEHLYAAGDQAVRLEYETTYALGPLCGITDPEAILHAAKLCDELGLDTISTGATLAFAMECAERGLLHDSELRFGNADCLQRMIRSIAHRRGLGDLLAEGSRRAAEIIGGDAARFAPHVKGLELPGYDPRTLQTLALGLAVSSRGADHNRSGAYEADFSCRTDRHHGSPASARLAIETEDRAALIDSLILCKFLRGVFTDLYAECADLLARVTGWDVTATELEKAAKRIVHAKKLFNIREGWTAAEDTLPPRLLEESSSADGVALPRDRLQRMIAAYYQARGWDESGLVPRSLAQEMDLLDLFPVDSSSCSPTCVSSTSGSP